MQYQDAFARMMGFEGLVAGIVFVLVGAAVLLALVLSRKRSGDTRRRSSHPAAEIGYAVMLGAAAGVLAFITASANNDLRAQVMPQASAAPPAATVDVDAFQWCWRFHYLNPDRTVTGSCATQQTDIPTLVVPAGQPVQLRLSSSDVQHAFWIPDLRVKVDAFPDHTNTFTLTFDHEGQWLGRCAEFCGSFHTEMHFSVRAVSPQQYQQWQAAST
ncbi:cytochrome c oxidase subunit II [Amycolatopsis pithecellobii]|uniref:Cytochrome aa3 subunit 2 n=1 Tax=Amycolatopsis pithecellobii TaxID=664692 RepID=A0A6N7YVB0_9PSEU|nr:cytochrome c oxidase subunit II [Amycolatopsis pithecellobii]MTD57005.1 cytochrome c oxidase subunit II [Amycolatopsis pithecellobii]